MHLQSLIEIQRIQFEKYLYDKKEAFLETTKLFIKRFLKNFNFFSLEINFINKLSLVILSYDSMT